MINTRISSATPQLSVVIPVYNELENLVPLLDEIDQALVPTGRSYEVIAVDDGSTDGSGERLLDLCVERPTLRLIRFRRNHGQAAAFDAGFHAAAAPLIVTLDADRQNDPADIPRMIAMLEAESLDFLSGCRAARQDRAFSRKLPSTIANRIIRLVTRTQVRDLGCSLKLYRAEVLREIRLYGEMHRFLAVLIEGTGARVGQMNVNHRPRVAGSSKYGLGRTFKVLLDLLTVWFMRGFQTNPIYAFGGIAMGLIGFSVALALWVLYDKFVNGIFVHRNPLFILSVGAGIVAVQFLALGLIAEIMIRIYFESRGKPPYLVGTTRGFEPAKPEPKPQIEAIVPRYARPGATGQTLPVMRDA